MLLFVLLSLLLLLSEVLSPTVRSIEASLQTLRYFNAASQAALRCMLSYWVPVQRSAVGQCEKNEDDMKKHQYSAQPAYPNFCVGFWAGAKHSRIPKNFPPPSDIANRLCTAKPANKIELDASAIQHAKT